MKIFKNILLLFAFSLNLYAEPKKKESVKITQRKNPKLAAFFGLIPGAGHLYLGDYLTAGIQFGFFGASLVGYSHFINHKDYLPSNERSVNFDFNYAVLGYAFQKSGILYSDFPLAGESSWERTYRLIQNRKLYEFNPLVKYGSYDRYNITSANADMATKMLLNMVFYSTYSAYRDAGGIPGREKETISDLMIAPFQFEYIKDPMVYAPLVGLLIVGYFSQPYQKTTLVSRTMGQDLGYLMSYDFYISQSAAVTEEAFFRGYLNYDYAKRMGPLKAGFLSGTLFGLAHLDKGMDVTSVIPQLLAGYYFAYMHYKNGWDIRKTIALHFWWDIIAIGFQLATYKVDPNADKNQKEVNFMPVLYSTQF
ncbi:MAG: CPBP family intramembrane metalloprotease [Leptospiraceae bacterium]|nr:CPBP family intramembrane metalloprotease [Leptospiraceae bacterium]